MQKFLPQINQNISHSQKFIQQNNGVFFNSIICPTFNKSYHKVEFFSLLQTLLWLKYFCFNFNIRKNKFRKFVDERVIRKNLFRKLRPFWTSQPQKFLPHIFLSQKISSLKVSHKSLARFLDFHKPSAHRLYVHFAVAPYGLSPQNLLHLLPRGHETAV